MRAFGSLGTRPPVVPLLVTGKLVSRRLLRGSTSENCSGSLSNGRI